MQNNGIIALPNGFLPANDPLTQLPAFYAAWEEVSAALPKLLLGDQFRSLFASYPILSIDKLQADAEYERGMLLLSYLAHAYVWGSREPANRIPAAIAVPLYQISQKLQRPPLLSYASYALHNWKRLDASKEIRLGNICLLRNFLGGIDEEWFVLIHVEIEAKAAPVLTAIIAAQQAVAAGDADLLTVKLQEIAIIINSICKTLDRMPEHCDPYIYYNRVRPYIHGWKDNAALPDGMLYEGVTAYQGVPQKFRGETGAQSSIMPTLDAALGIKHKADPLKLYLQEMRDYMPVAHRQFINTVEQGHSIRDFVLQHANIKLLKEYYNECIKFIARFRQTHLTYAANYIQNQVQTSASNPTTTGTGGTPFMAYLKKHKDESLDFII